MAHQGERAKAVGDVREESMGGGTGAVPSAAEAEKGEASTVCIRMVEIGVKESGHCTDGHRPIIALTNGENMVGWPPPMALNYRLDIPCNVQGPIMPLGF